jgi:hypothetical protein
VAPCRSILGLINFFLALWPIGPAKLPNPTERADAVARDLPIKVLRNMAQYLTFAPIWSNFAKIKGKICLFST